MSSNMYVTGWLMSNIEIESRSKKVRKGPQ